MFKFLTSKTFLALFALALAAGVVAPAAFAQSPQGGGALDFGPFGAFLDRTAKLFSATRYAIYVCAAFAFVMYAWNAIKEGKLEIDKLFWLIVALVLLGIAGSLVDWLVGSGSQVTTKYSDFKDINQGGTWGAQGR